jgi:hypothetical protein
MDEADDACIKILDEWIKNKKDVIYDEYITNATNQSVEQFIKYEEALENFAKPLIKSVESENIDLLKEFQWPDELVECIKDPNTQILIIDSIKKWCKHYPYVNCKPQIKELEEENKGINQI